MTKKKDNDNEIKDNKKRNIKYVEPSDYFPKEIRKKCKIGEFAEESNKKQG